MPSKCCYFVPLRIGSIILGVLGTLVSLFGIVGTGGRWPAIIFGILFLFPSACLLFGTIKNNEKAVLLSIIMGVASFLISIIIAIIVFAMIQSIYPELANDCEALSAYLDCDKLKFEVRKSFGYGYATFVPIYIYFWGQTCILFIEMKEKTEGENSPNAEEMKAVPIYVYFWSQTCKLFTEMKEKTEGKNSPNAEEMKAGGEGSPA